MFLRRATPLLVLVASLLAPWPLHAEDYPSKRVRIVIPYPPGGPTDAFGRVIAQEMGRSFGTTMVVEHRPGAGGVIGTEEVARSPADGYALLMNASVQVTYTGVFKNLKFDPMNDFEPVGLLGSAPLVAVVPTLASYRTLAALVEAAEARPGALSYASPARGSLSHLVGELFDARENVRMTHVRYRGIAPALTDLAGGHVDLMYAPLATAMPMVRAGRLRALAVTTATRLDALPDVPTFNEAGVKGFDVATWYGVWAPRGTPRNIVDKLNQALRAALESGTVKSMLHETGTVSRQLTATQFAEFAAPENRRWLKVMTDANIQQE